VFKSPKILLEVFLCNWFFFAGVFTFFFFQEWNICILFLLQSFIAIWSANECLFVVLVSHHEIQKPSNVLISRSGGVKIADFGISRLDVQKKTLGEAGTCLYMAPECFSSTESAETANSALSTLNGSRADVYSFGVLLLELFGVRPYGEIAVSDTTNVVQFAAMLRDKRLKPQGCKHCFFFFFFFYLVSLFVLFS
jgi:hypothetical protein